MDVENRRLKEELSTAKKEAAHWGQKYHELWYEVKPYLDALHPVSYTHLLLKSGFQILPLSMQCLSMFHLFLAKRLSKRFLKPMPLQRILRLSLIHISTCSNLSSRLILRQDGVQPQLPRPGQ